MSYRDLSTFSSIDLFFELVRCLIRLIPCKYTTFVDKYNNKGNRKEVQQEYFLPLQHEELVMSQKSLYGNNIGRPYEIYS